MSERGLNGSLDGPKSKASVSEYRLPRPMSYHLKLMTKNQSPATNREEVETAREFPSLPTKVINPSAPLRIKNRAIIPNKKNIEFTLQTSPKEKAKEEIEDIIDLTSRLVDDNPKLHIVKSLDSWESRDFEFGGDFGAKSVPFSQPYNPDLETNRNIFDDGIETIKFSILQQTPKR